MTWPPTDTSPWSSCLIGMGPALPPLPLHMVAFGRTRFMPENQPTTTAEKTGKNRMQPCAYSCARAKAWNLRVYSVGRTRCHISLEAAGPEQ